jgi:hypothetical protein
MPPHRRSSIQHFDMPETAGYGSDQDAGDPEATLLSVH